VPVKPLNETTVGTSYVLLTESTALWTSTGSRSKLPNPLK